jgi:NAD(P)-dependent dehydrogenase (short-subunit alcohol dehydrogenase family)
MEHGVTQAGQGLSALSLEGLRALVTGAGSGLGRQLALGLAEAGASVVLCGRRADAIEATAQLVSNRGGTARVLRADVTREEDVLRLAQEAGRIDILVNNAGVSRIQAWDSVSMEEWREVMALNVDAPFRLCQLFVPAMIERGWGRVINVGSVYGTQSGDPRNYPDMAWDLPGYVVSKHALVGMTRYLATTLANDGVCVNMISPGMFPTEGNERRLTTEIRSKLAEATPMRRLGTQDDLQAAAVFLASDGARFVTGQNVMVDGGWSLW